jgi:hypothetical protein
MFASYKALYPALRTTMHDLGASRAEANGARDIAVASSAR